MKSIPGIGVRVATLAVVPMVSAALLTAQEPIFPGDPRWNEDPANHGTTVEITATQPFMGNGSLQFDLGQTSENTLPDWGYYVRLAGPAETSSFGLLNGVDQLGFSWYRTDLGAPEGVVSWDPFMVQSPVFRVLVRDEVDGESFFSELVWEYYYNQNGRPVEQQFALDRWFTEDLLNQVFWLHLTDPASQERYSNTPNCAFGEFLGRDQLYLAAVHDWTSCFSENAVVYGVKIGVGSNWPAEFQGFADNVQLGFNDQETLAIWDNFEFPDGPTSTVPEPATLILLGSGLVAVGGTSLIRRRSRTGGSKNLSGS